MNRLKVDDEVVVISGRDKGKRGYVVSMVGEDRVLVSDVNLVKKHIKARREGEQSRVSTEPSPIHISNVAIFNPLTSKPDKVKFVVEEGEKHRVFKSDGERVMTDG